MAQQTTEKATAVASTLANPAPLGLMGFGATTLLLNLHNAGIVSAASFGMIFAMGLFYGGVAQVIAGVLEARRGNTFGMLAFASFGMFWIALVALLVFPKAGLADAVDNVSMAWFLGTWGLFTAFMFVATLKKNRALQVIFGTLTLLFILLAAGEYTQIDWVTKLAGYEGLLCGLSAIYLACAEVLNETYGRQVLPV